MGSTPKDKRYYSSEITDRFFVAMDRILGSRTGGKITALAFGDSVGISSSNLGRIRNTPGQFVTVEAVGRLCHHYGISPAWLIMGLGDPDASAEANDKLDGRMKELEKTVTSLQKEIITIKKKVKL